MIQTLTIKSRFIINFLLVAVTITGIVSASLFGMSKAGDSLKTVFQDRIIALDQLGDIESLILQNRIAIMTSLVTSTPDEISINIASLEMNATKIDKLWAAYMATYLTSEEKILAAQFADDRKKYVTQGLNPAIAALRANNFTEMTRIILETIEPLYQPVHNGIKALGNLQLSVTKQEYENLQNHYDIIRNFIISIAIIGLGLAIWQKFSLVRAISQPLEGALNIARSVAAGNLTQKIEVHATDEIGQLMKALKEIHDHLVKVIGQVRDSEARIHKVLDNIDEGIITINEGGLIEIFNPVAEQIFGYKKHEVIGKNFNLLMREPSRDQQWNKPTAFGLNNEVVGVRKDGTNFPLEYHTREIQFHMGQFNIVITRDLTAIKQAAAAHKKFAQVRRRNAQLEASARVRTEFFATISHELRTPLNAIIGFSEALRDGLIGDLTDEQRSYMGDILESGKHQLALINDMMDISKMEAGKMSLHLEPVNLASLLSSSLTIVREKAAAQHIHLNLDIANQLVDIQTDVRKVKQIVYNLLSNAVKFTSKGGDITLRARRVSHTQVGQLTGRWAGLRFPWSNDHIMNFIEISVTDSGIGIDTEDFERLFTPFSQIDSGMVGKFEGSGLGLAIVKNLAELFGGTVAVESAKGQGTCFTVWLPLCPTEEVAAALTEESVDPVITSPLMALRHSEERFALVADDDPKAVEEITTEDRAALNPQVNKS